MNFWLSETYKRTKEKNQYNLTLRKTAIRCIFIGLFFLECPLSIQAVRIHLKCATCLMHVSYSSRWFINANSWQLAIGAQDISFIWTMVYCHDCWFLPRCLLIIFVIGLLYMSCWCINPTTSFIYIFEKIMWCQNICLKLLVKIDIPVHCNLIPFSAVIV